MRKFLEFSNLVETLRHRAIHQPNKIGFTFLIDGESQKLTYTYTELDEKARSIAAHLQSQGKYQDRALLVYPPGLDYVAAFIGCLYAGIVAVPVYPPDPMRLQRTLPRLKAIIENVQPNYALTTASILTYIESILSQNPFFKPMRWIPTDTIDVAAAIDWTRPDPTEAPIAFIQYTSGSTGSPKGVMISHDNLMSNSKQIQRSFGHTQDSVGVIWLPPYHDMGLIGGIVQPLYSGFPVVLMSPIAFLQKPFRWLDAISRYKGTTSGGPNFAFDLCVRKITPQQRQTLDLSTWNLAFNGSEPIRIETLRRFSNTFSCCGFSQQAFYPCYGLAEMTLIATGGIKECQPKWVYAQTESLINHNLFVPENNFKKAKVFVGCGNPILEHQLCIVNHQTHSLCNNGEIGEIWLSGSSVAKGYYNNPTETQAIFQATIETNQYHYLSKNWLKTGDLGFCLSGELYVTGRKKDMIIIRGENHYPQDIEYTVEKSYSWIRPGCVAAFEVDVDGENHVVIVAEVERRRNDQPNPYQDRRIIVELPEHIPVFETSFESKRAIYEIRRAVSERHGLQVYAVILIKVGSIPKTSSGKIQRHACKIAFANSTFDSVDSDFLDVKNKSQGVEYFSIDHNRLHSLPADQQYEMIRSCLFHSCSYLFKIPVSQLDTKESLAVMGIDSVIAIELQHEIQTYFGIELSITIFFSNTSLDQLCIEVQNAIKDKIPTDVSCINLPNSHVKESFELSYNQKSIWFMYQFSPKSPAYNLFFGARIRSHVDSPSFKNAFWQLIQKHPALRTTYYEKNGLPLQTLHDTPMLDFKEIDACNFTELQLLDAITTESHTPFQLETGPILRITLYKLAPDDYIVLFVIHHIAIDLWSFPIILEEFKTAYSTHHILSLQHSELAENYRQIQLQEHTEKNYLDFVIWQQHMLNSPEGEKLKKYWLNQLSGELPVLDLPTDRPRPSIQTFNGESFPFYINDSLHQQIKEIARSNDSTVYMVYLSALQILLSRYSGQNEILIGTPTVSRSKLFFQDIVGFFTNTLVIRATIKENRSFQDHLTYVRDIVLSDLNHQDFPFSLLVEYLNPKRDRSPLFQVMFALQKTYRMENIGAFALKQEGPVLLLDDLKLESMHIKQRIAQFDLTLMMAETPHGMMATWEYNTDLFHETTIRRMTRHFEMVLQSIVQKTDIPLNDILLMDSIERDRILSQCKLDDTYQDVSVIQLIEEQSTKNADHIALVFKNGQMNYQQVNHMANSLANYLMNVKKLQPEDRVGVMLERSPSVVIAMLGIFKAHGVYMPVDPNYPESRIQYMIEVSNCRIMLTQKNYVHALNKIMNPENIVDIEQVQLVDQDNPKHAYPSADQLSYVLFTSGSTGKPKAVMQTHRCINNLISWQIKQTGTKLRILNFAALGFDVSIQEILYSLASGSTLYIIPEDMRYDMPQLSEYLINHEINIIILPFTALHMLFTYAKTISTNSFLQHIITSGETLKLFPELITYLKAHPDVILHNQYGPTETHVVTSYRMSGKDHVDMELLPPIGSPIDHTQIFILDAQMRPVPIGIRGEIFIDSVNVARGYLNDTKLTDERFIPHPFKPNGLVYRTGDIGRFQEDGNIQFLGRNDDQVKIRGHRIELHEIEQCLLQHPMVTEAVVIAKPFQGSGLELTGYVTSQHKLNSEDLRIHLKSQLPNYMIPTTIVLLDEFRRTANGKVDRQRLPDPSIYTIKFASKTDTVLLNETEAHLMSIWKTVLGLEHISISDSFFDLGGHSLKAVQMANRIQQQFGMNLAVSSIFQYPTIHELALIISRMKEKDSGNQTPIMPPTPEEIEQLKELLHHI
ncbi:MAG: amino acid adenylation domain-containing protein [Desulfobacterales bacterium]|nr:amino acid adenylation domain-containing protein [Desulfobacterales bacterium]